MPFREAKGADLARLGFRPSAVLKIVAFGGALPGMVRGASERGPDQMGRSGCFWGEALDLFKGKPSFLGKPIFREAFLTEALAGRGKWNQERQFKNEAFEGPLKAHVAYAPQYLWNLRYD